MDRGAWYANSPWGHKESSTTERLHFLSLLPFEGRDFPGGSEGKESTCNEGDLSSIPGLGKFLGGGHGNSLPYSCLENPWIEERQVDAKSPWGRKELDVTE